MQYKQSFRQFPTVKIRGYDTAATAGCDGIRQQLSRILFRREKTVIVAECYPGVNQGELLELLSPLHPAEIICSDGLALPPEEIDALIRRDLTEDDPVFGIMTTRRLEEFFPTENLENARRKIEGISSGLILVYGVGASLVCRGDILVMADITRWEIQLRYRKVMPNWRTAQEDLPKNKKYKRGYFAEWRWADRVKDRLLPEMDFYLDMTTEHAPSMVTGQAYRDALEQVSRQPFRMVPYFDPGVWGGDWMKTHFELPENGSNYAWSFDGVPEENSLLLDFGGTLVQTPALNLVHSCPRQLLGERVHGRFGAEFPIRFDMLDTMNGQNLSLQVHPLTEYIQQNFNMHYTQDESYYLLDVRESEPCGVSDGSSCAGSGSVPCDGSRGGLCNDSGDGPCVFLGIKTGADPQAMIQALEDAQNGIAPFPAENFVNRIPVKKHDHVLIPAGTVHCSGANTMVLEISATPYIFTFKLWDWGRLDLDGRPRPIHIEHGAANIQWDRNTEWVKENLVNCFTLIHEDGRGTVERTGLHEREFLDTFRVSTSGEMPIHRNGSVHVMNLVEGGRATLSSDTGQFAPFELHYAETCIIPEAAGPYSILSTDGGPIKAIIACVRN